MSFLLQNVSSIEFYSMNNRKSTDLRAIFVKSSDQILHAKMLQLKFLEKDNSNFVPILSSFVLNAICNTPEPASGSCTAKCRKPGSLLVY